MCTISFTVSRFKGVENIIHRTEKIEKAMQQTTNARIYSNSISCKNSNILCFFRVLRLVHTLLTRNLSQRYRDIK